MERRSTATPGATICPPAMPHRRIVCPCFPAKCAPSSVPFRQVFAPCTHIHGIACVRRRFEKAKADPAEFARLTRLANELEDLFRYDEL